MDNILNECSGFDGNDMIIGEESVPEITISEDGVDKVVVDTGEKQSGVTINNCNLSTLDRETTKLTYDMDVSYTCLDGLTLTDVNNTGQNIPFGEMNQTEHDGQHYEPMSYELQEGFRILKEVMSHANKSVNWPFMEAVDTEELGLLDYYDRIKKPMWLGKMKEKFEKGEYSTVTEFVADMRLMLENCYRYNGPDHAISKRGQKLETVLEQKLALLTRELREKTSISATSGHPVEEHQISGTRRRKVIIPHDSSALLNQLRQEEQQRQKEQRQQVMQERKKEQEAYLKDLQEWEDESVFGQNGLEYLNAVWEIPQIGHFLFLSADVMNIGEVMHWELERSFFLPKQSSTMQRVMTALLSTPYQRTKLDKKPMMPYSVWEEKLRVKLRQFYKCLKDNGKDIPTTCRKLGLEDKFFEVVGLKNPLERKKFDELTFYQRVWIVKGLCDLCLETPSVKDAIDAQDIVEQREYLLGYDAQGNSYMHFPQFCGQDLRIYKQSPLPIPKMDKPVKPDKRKQKFMQDLHDKIEAARNLKGAEKKSNSKKKKKQASSRRPTPSPSPSQMSRSRDCRLRQNPRMVTKESGRNGSCSESDIGDSDIGEPEAKSTRFSPYGQKSDFSDASRADTPSRNDSGSQSRSSTPTISTGSTPVYPKSRRLQALIDSRDNTPSRSPTPSSLTKELDIQNLSRGVSPSPSISSTSSSPRKNKKGYRGRSRRRGGKKRTGTKDKEDDTNVDDENITNEKSTKDKYLTTCDKPDGDEANMCDPSDIIECVEKEEELIDIAVKVTKRTPFESYTNDKSQPECQLVEVKCDSPGVESDDMDKSDHTNTEKSCLCEQQTSQERLQGNGVISSATERSLEGDINNSSITCPEVVKKKGFDANEDAKHSVLQDDLKENLNFDKNTSELLDEKVIIKDNEVRIKEGSMKQEWECEKEKLSDAKVEDIEDLANVKQERECKANFDGLPSNQEKSILEAEPNDIKEEEPEQESDFEWEEVVPEVGMFQLIADSVEGLKDLVLLFAETEPTIEKRGKKEKVIKPPPRKKCEKELYDRLLYLLKELEPWDQKLIQANKRAKMKLRKEYETYEEEEAAAAIKEVDDVWESEEPQSSSDEDTTNSDEDIDDDKQDLKAAMREKRAAARKLATEEDRSAANTPTPEDLELGISSRGRIRKRRFIPNNIEDPGFLKKKKVIEPKALPTTSVVPKTVAQPQVITSSDKQIQLPQSIQNSGYSLININNQTVLVKGLNPVLLQQNVPQSVQAVNVGQLQNSNLVAQLAGQKAHTITTYATTSVSSSKITKSGQTQIKPSTQEVIKALLAMKPSAPPQGVEQKAQTTAASVGGSHLAAGKLGIVSTPKGQCYQYNNVSELPPNVIQQLLKAQNIKLKTSTALSTTPTIMQSNTVANTNLAGLLQTPVSHLKKSEQNTSRLKQSLSVPTVSHIQLLPGITMQPKSNNSIAQTKQMTNLVQKTSQSQTAEITSATVGDPQEVKSSLNTGMIKIMSPKQPKYTNNVTVKTLLETRAAQLKSHGDSLVPKTVHENKTQGSSVTGHVMSTPPGSEQKLSVAPNIVQGQKMIPCTNSSSAKQLVLIPRNDGQHQLVFAGQPVSATRQHTGVSVSPAKTLQTPGKVQVVNKAQLPNVQMLTNQVPQQTQIVSIGGQRFQLPAGMVPNQVRLVSPPGGQIVAPKMGQTVPVQFVQTHHTPGAKVVLSQPVTGSQQVVTQSTHAPHTAIKQLFKEDHLTPENVVRMKPVNESVIDNAVKAVITSVPTSLPTAQMKVPHFEMPTMQQCRPCTTTTLAMKKPIPAVLQNPGNIAQTVTTSITNIKSSIPSTGHITTASSSQALGNQTVKVTQNATGQSLQMGQKNVVLKVSPQNIMTSKGVVQGVVLPSGVVVPLQSLHTAIAKGGLNTLQNTQTSTAQASGIKPNIFQTTQQINTPMANTKTNQPSVQYIQTPSGQTEKIQLQGITPGGVQIFKAASVAAPMVKTDGRILEVNNIHNTSDVIDQQNLPRKGLDSTSNSEELKNVPIETNVGPSIQTTGLSNLELLAQASIQKVEKPVIQVTHKSPVVTQMQIVHPASSEAVTDTTVEKIPQNEIPHSDLKGLGIISKSNLTSHNMAKEVQGVQKGSSLTGLKIIPQTPTPIVPKVGQQVNIMEQGNAKILTQSQNQVQGQIQQVAGQSQGIQNLLTQTGQNKVVLLNVGGKLLTSQGVPVTVSNGVLQPLPGSVQIGNSGSLVKNLIKNTVQQTATSLSVTLPQNSMHTTSVLSNYNFEQLHQNSATHQNTFQVQSSTGGVVTKQIVGHPYKVVTQQTMSSEQHNKYANMPLSNVSLPSVNINPTTLQKIQQFALQGQVMGAAQSLAVEKRSATSTSQPQNLNEMSEGSDIKSSSAPNISNGNL